MISDPQIMKGVILDKAISRALRKTAVDRLSTLEGCAKACLEIFQRSDECWLMFVVMDKIDVEKRNLPFVREKTYALWKSEQLSLDCRAYVYVNSKGIDYSKAEDQEVLARAMTSSRIWKQVFNKVVANKDLVDLGIMLRLALRSYKGDKSVALWAVGNLDDAGLMTVVRESEDDEILYKAIRQIRADSFLVELTLDESLDRNSREVAFACVIGRRTVEVSCRSIYLKTKEFWLANRALTKLGDRVRAEKCVTDRSLSWMKNEKISLDDRARVYLAIPDGVDYSGLSDQRLLCMMIAMAKESNRVFAKVVREGSLTSGSEIVKLADGGYTVAETVSMWAVDHLDDSNLLTVIKKARNPRILFNAVCNLKKTESVVNVSRGRYETVARLAAINRLGIESDSVLQEIAKSEDANFRDIALQRMKKLGIPTENAKKAAEEIARKENEAKAAERKKQLVARSVALKAAKHDIELAKIDEKIGTYISTFGVSLAIGTEFTFRGTIVSITSRNWRPKIRILVKGANKSLDVLCLVQGKFQLPVKEGTTVIVSGKFKTGNSSEIVLSDAVISIDAEVK